MSLLLERVDAIEPEIVQVWKHIHQNPELGMELYNTAALIESELKKQRGFTRRRRTREKKQIRKVFNFFR